MRGAVAAIERLSFRRAGSIGERIGRLGYAPLGIRRAVVERQLARGVPGARRRRDRAHRARGVRDISAERASRRRCCRRTAPKRSSACSRRCTAGSIVEERLARGQGADPRHRPSRQLGARRRLCRGAGHSDRRRRATHGEPAVRSISDEHASADRHDRRARRGGRSPRPALAARRARGGVPRRSGRGRTRVDVGAVLRPLREDAARTGRVRAAARRADRVRRRAAAAVGTVSAHLRAGRRRRHRRPRSRRRPHRRRVHARCSSVGCDERRSSTSGIIVAGSTSVRERRASLEIRRCEPGDAIVSVGSSARGSASA